MPRSRSDPKEKETIWNLNKEGGWEDYENKTQEIASQLDDAIYNENNSIEDIMKKLEKLQYKAKYAAFGKTRKPERQKGKQL